MKNKILAGTALLFSCPEIANAAEAPMAQTRMPKLMISGQTTFNAWWFNNKDQKNRNDGNIAHNGGLAEGQTPLRGAVLTKTGLSGSDSQSHGRGYLFTMDDSELRFKLSGVSDYGADYGMTVVVDTNTEQTTSHRIIEENYIWMGGSWGRIALGDTYGSEDLMAFGGFDPIAGTGGFDGNFDRVINLVTGTLTSVDLLGYTDTSTKFTYQTPRFYGFQAGISFTPQSGHLGEDDAKTTTDYGLNGDIQPFDKRSIAAALNYINEWSSGFSLGVSATSVFAKTQPGFTGSQWFVTDSTNTVIATGSSNRKNTASYAIGTSMSYGDFEWGFEFGDNGKSHEVKDFSSQTGVKTNAGWFIDMGLAYNFGSTKISAGYMYTKRKSAKLDAAKATGFSKAKSRADIISASVDRKLAQGVGIYFEYVHLNMRNSGFDVDAMINNSSNMSPGTTTLASGGALTGPVGPKQRANAFVVGTKVKF